MIDRRGILKLLSVIPGSMALPAAGAVAPLLAAAEVAVGAASATVRPLRGAKKVLGKSLYAAVCRARNALHDDVNLRARLQIDGLDADIGALKSLSRSTQVRMQNKRIRSDQALAERLFAVVAFDDD